MSKKLMMLAAGALTALAFTALPSVASAGEVIATCQGGAATCTGNVVGGAAELEDKNGLTVKCTANTGTATLNNNTSTGAAELTFTGCKSSGFACNSAGSPAETITTTPNPLTAHIVKLEPGQTLPIGLLLTGVSTTFSCAGGLVKKTVTGNVIGEIEIVASECSQFLKSHKANFAAGVTTGSQKWTQTTTMGPIFHLTSGTHTGGSPDDTITSSQKATGTINWATSVAIDC